MGIDQALRNFDEKRTENRRRSVRLLDVDQQTRLDSEAFTGAGALAFCPRTATSELVVFGDGGRRVCIPPYGIYSLS